MRRPNRQDLSDLRGFARVAVDATLGVTGVVEQMHRTIQQTPLPWARRAGERRTRGITGFVYRRVNATTRLVGTVVDAALAPLADRAASGTPSPSRDGVVSALNGLYGDHLARTRNPLALDLSLRYAGECVDPAQPVRLRAALNRQDGSARLLVLVHGLCLNERHWMRNGHDHGAALARDLGVVPLYVRYNTGLSIATNGRALARALDRLLRALRGSTFDVAILAHSMGGLVTRSAFEHGRRRQHLWPSRVRDCVFLGTPHHGAPLEQAGHRLGSLLELSPYVTPFKRLISKRSAGITDLRSGRVVGDMRRRVPLPPGVRCYAVAATLASTRAPLGDDLLGDGLVPLDSALGRHRDALRDLGIAPERQYIGRGRGHLDLLDDGDVYVCLRDWFA